MQEPEFNKIIDDMLNKGLTLEGLIITFKMYDDDTHFHFENELLLVNLSSGNYYEWYSDWNEGQKYEIMGLMPLSCALTMQLTDNNTDKLIKCLNGIRSSMYKRRSDNA